MPYKHEPSQQFTDMHQECWRLISHDEMSEPLWLPLFAIQESRPNSITSLIATYRVGCCCCNYTVDQGLHFCQHAAHLLLVMCKRKWHTTKASQVYSFARLCRLVLCLQEMTASFKSSLHIGPYHMPISHVSMLISTADNEVMCPP